MFEDSAAFSSFSVDDLVAAEEFYGDTLGLDVVNGSMGLEIKVADSHPIFVYAKPNHLPATYTVLNFPVDDIDMAIDALAEQGVTMLYYEEMEGQDDKGVVRGRAANMGPDIAWFNDPAGNVLAVMQN